VDPPAQSNTHPPPAHEPSHVAPAAQCTTHRPPAHVGEHVEPDRQVTSQLPPWHEGVQSPVHEQPASAVACAAQAGSEAASAAASDGEPSTPPSLAAQSARTPGSSSATVHCTASPDATAVWHVCLGPALVQESHSLASCAHGSGPVLAVGVPESQAAATSATTAAMGQSSRGWTRGRGITGACYATAARTHAGLAARRRRGHVRSHGRGGCLGEDPRAGSSRRRGGRFASRHRRRRSAGARARRGRFSSATVDRSGAHAAAGLRAAARPRARRARRGGRLTLRAACRPRAGSSRCRW